VATSSSVLGAAAFPLFRRTLRVAVAFISHKNRIKTKAKVGPEPRPLSPPSRIKQKENKFMITRTATTTAQTQEKIHGESRANCGFCPFFLRLSPRTAHLAQW